MLIEAEKTITVTLTEREAISIKWAILHMAGSKNNLADHQERLDYMLPMFESVVPGTV